MSLNVVITMAGRGSRFYEAGYTVPKYEIMAHGRSLFDWSILSLRNFLTPDSRVIFVCLEKNNSARYVRQQSQALGICDVHVVELSQLTDGQATSAYLSRELWQLTEPLLIYNIDTYVNPDALKPSDIPAKSDGWLPCFQAPGDHWSFVKLGQAGWAEDVVEKKRISNFASVGLYWFARAGEYVSAYDQFFSNPTNLVRGERYIAPMYRQMIADCANVSITDLPIQNVHALGTPAELEIFLAHDFKDI
jgi:dTDP-glucose pyrophosphorylase